MSLHCSSEKDPAKSPTQALAYFRELGWRRRTYVDEIKLDIIVPRLEDIIDLEFAVWWNPSLPRRRQIDAKNDSGRKVICDLFRPNATPSADVENVLNIVSNWAQEVRVLPLCLQQQIHEVSGLHRQELDTKSQAPKSHALMRWESSPVSHLPDPSTPLPS